MTIAPALRMLDATPLPTADDRQALRHGNAAALFPALAALLGGPR